jgi:hypothetical protein
VQRLPHPFAKQTMEALQVLVEEGNKQKKEEEIQGCPMPTSGAAGDQSLYGSCKRRPI